MVHELRPYQIDARDAVVDAFNEGYDRVGVVMPTGVGKTEVAFGIIKKMMEDEQAKGRRRPSLMVAHREKLVTQNAARAAKQFPNYRVGIEMAESKAAPYHNLISASIQSIGRKGSHRLPFVAASGSALFWCDEMHHAAADGYINAAKKYGCFDSRTPFFGCTATPHRLDQKQLVDEEGRAIIEKIVYQMTLMEAIKAGYLCKVRAKTVVTGTDLSKVAKNRTGDYDTAALSKAVDTTVRTKKAINHWREVAEDRVTIVFCVDIKHVDHTVEAFQAEGYKAIGIHSNMQPEQVTRNLDDFKSGKCDILVNCGICTEGFDYPPISCVLMLRPTMSWVLFMQCIGRGTRLFEGKEDAIIIDCVDNFGTHDVCSIPKMVGLPKDFEADGEELLELEDASNKIKSPGMGRGKRFGNMEDVRTAIRDIDIFKEAQTPYEIETFARLNWVKIGSGYVVQLASGEAASLNKDAMGVWRVKVNGRLYPADLGKTTFPNFNLAESMVQLTFPEHSKVLVRDPSAKTRPAEFNIKNALKIKMVASPDAIDQMTQEQAYNLLVRSRASDR